MDLQEIKDERQRWEKVHSVFWTQAIDWLIPEIESLQNLVQKLEWDYAEAMAVVLSHEAYIEKLKGQK